MDDEQTPFHTELRHYGPALNGQARTILVGVDGSTTSMRACHHAFGLAGRQSARLIAVFAADHSLVDLVSSGIELEHETQEQVYDELGEEIRQAAEDYAVPATFALVHGDAATVLRDVADRCGADTVVVGRSTQAGHRIAGAVGARLIRAGHWPVLVVP